MCWVERRAGEKLTFLSDISTSSLACKLLRICFAEIVCRSPLARTSSIIALYCAFSEGRTGDERISRCYFPLLYSDLAQVVDGVTHETSSQ